MTDQEYLIEKADEAFEARLARLIAAGFRLVAPGEIDPETVERCAQAIHCGCTNYCDFDEAEETIRSLSAQGEER